MKFKIIKGNQTTTIHESDLKDYEKQGWEVLKAIPENIIEADELDGIMFPGNEMSED